MAGRFVARYQRLASVLIGVLMLAINWYGRQTPVFKLLRGGQDFLAGNMNPSIVKRCLPGRCWHRSRRPISVTPYLRAEGLKLTADYEYAARSLGHSGSARLDRRDRQYASGVVPRKPSLNPQAAQDSITFNVLRVERSTDKCVVQADAAKRL